MIKALKELYTQCELVLFTYLPKAFMEAIKEKLPELSECFSYIICREDILLEQAANTEEWYLVKDIGKLLYSRSTEEIIVVETDQKRIDDNFLSSFIFLQYDGSINYS
jgi:NLI interacting factor-like phosphatase